MPAALKDQVNLVIKNIKALHPEDLKVYDYWDEITALLTADEQESITFLMTCDDAETIDYISSSFKDIAYKLQSQRFIDCLDILEKKFPEILIKHMIAAARAYMTDPKDESGDIT